MLAVTGSFAWLILGTSWVSLVLGSHAMSVAGMLLHPNLAFKVPVRRHAWIQRRIYGAGSYTEFHDRCMLVTSG